MNCVHLCCNGWLNCVHLCSNITDLWVTELCYYAVTLLTYGWLNCVHLYSNITDLWTIGWLDFWVIELCSPLHQHSWFMGDLIVFASAVKFPMFELLNCVHPAVTCLMIRCFKCVSAVTFWTSEWYNWVSPSQAFLNCSDPIGLVSAVTFQMIGWLKCVYLWSNIPDVCVIQWCISLL